MRTKSKVSRWGRILRRARDLVGLALLVVAWVFRNRAARQRWQDSGEGHRSPRT
jgi:hypothetical protein